MLTRIYTEIGKLKIAHPELIGGKTYLTTQTAAGANSSTVENNDGFSTNDYVVLGGLGEEKTEIVLVTSTTGSTTLGHTGTPNFTHPIDTPVFEIPYNQVEVHTASSESGTYSLAATLDLAVDQKFTEYTTASATWYKTRYKNSNATTYSAYSPAVQGTGWDSSSLGYMINEAANEFGDPNLEEISYQTFRRYARDAVVKIARDIARLNLPTLTTYTTQAHTNGTALYDLPARFIRFRKIDIAFDGSNSYRAIFEPEAAGLPDTTYDKTDARVYRRGTQYGIRPTPDSDSGITYLWYDAYPAEMSDDNDTHGLPYGAHDVIISYLLYRAWLSKGESKAGSYLADYRASAGDYLQSLSTGFQDYVLPTLHSRDSDLYGLAQNMPTEF